MFATLRAKQPGASIGSLLLYRLFSGTMQVVLRTAFRLRAVDPHHVPRTGGLIIVCNHQSYLDPPAVGGIIDDRRHFDFLARVGLFTFKPFGWLISALNSIPIRGDGNDTSSIKEVLRRLDMGRAIIIFPEGGRTEDGAMQEFKRGAALLVKRSHCPVVPAAIDGAFEAWPRAERFPRFFRHRVTVIYGAPIDHDELMKEGADAAMARLHTEVSTLLARLRAGQAVGR